ncbi:MAG: hypothetical protein NC094_12515 [Bacteroidales bacterium]|nr:hypothetical protein [Lachnoclostridium sp.]MCM1385507.1 hypothetical protein [Lachnoclostridium sp.]MCM1466231.1 hypothetical protein [Bacteroidales bacterium]
MSDLIHLEDKHTEKEADRQKAIRLMEALSGVDGELLERSEGVQGAIPFWRYGKQLAACFVLVAMGACVFGVYSVTSNKKDASGSGYAFLKPQSVENGAMAGGSDGASADMEPQEEAYRNDLGFEKEAPSAEMKSEAGVPMQNAVEDMQEAGKKSQADTSMENGVLGGEEFSTAQSSNKSPSDSDQVEVCLGDVRPEITLREAKEMERIGGYVPETIPAGYQLESARGTSPDNSYLDMSLCWCKGMDDIMLHITEFYAVASMPADAYDSFQKRIVDPERPESYNVNFYEIPYADTVPMEYFEVFYNPVFTEADFSLEMVEARMKSVPDAGDTSTPRGNFAVLYDSGILVEFNGKGSAEEIWEMFASIHP